MDLADEHERAHADELPRDEQQKRVVGHDQEQHRRREEIEEREVVRVPAVTRHVPRREHVYEERHQRDHEQHHHGQAVDVDADTELHVGVLPPREAAIDGGDERDVFSFPLSEDDFDLRRLAISDPRWPQVIAAALKSPHSKSPSDHSLTNWSRRRLPQTRRHPRDDRRPPPLCHPPRRP